jgi:hypothetical protein
MIGSCFFYLPEIVSSMEEEVEQSGWVIVHRHTGIGQRGNCPCSSIDVQHAHTGTHPTAVAQVKVARTNFTGGQSLKNANLAPFSPYSPLFGEPVVKASNTTGC